MNVNPFMRDLLIETLRGIGVAAWQGRLSAPEIRLMIEKLHKSREKIATRCGELGPRRRAKGATVDGMVDHFIRTFDAGKPSSEHEEGSTLHRAVV